MSALLDDVANKQFDYVICGGGTAGMVLATRLSEDPSISVAVIETSPANLDDPDILRPARWGSHFANPNYATPYHTVPQKHSGNHKYFCGRGRGVGGSAAINFMCWVKPPAKDIDDFERLGNPGWNWENYHKYQMRSERFIEPTEAMQKNGDLHSKDWELGKEGPLCVCFPEKIDKAEFQLQETLLNAGIPRAPNPMNGNPEGFFITPNTYDPATHSRSYVGNVAFYQPNQGRPNLTVLVNAHVLLVETRTGADGLLTATGVKFDHSGKTHVVYAKKEVILSAGALKSPQILELSGIGRKDVLEKINTPMKRELPGVGENVQDHVFVGLSWELRDEVEFDTIDLLRDPELRAKHLELHKSGEGVHTIGIVGFAFASLFKMSSEARNAEIIAAVKARLAEKAKTLSPGLAKQYEIQMERLERGAPGCELISIPGIMSGPNPPKEGRRYATFLAAINHIWSRGMIHSVSNDPYAEPDIDPQYFAEEVDLEILVEVVKFSRRIANEVSPLKDMIVKEQNPGAHVQTDEEIRDWIKATLSTTWHTAGSCSMLPEAMGGVVDPALRVYGTTNLRVVDLSMVPLHFAAHSMSTVYAIAEMAADIIRGKFPS